MEFINSAWGTANTKQNSALENLVQSEKNKLTSSLEAIEALEAKGRRNKQTKALEVLQTSALDALVQSEKNKLIADLKAIEALEAQVQRGDAPVAEETREPSLQEKSPASPISEDMPKIWDRVMNMPGLSNEEKRQLWMMILNGSTQKAGGREGVESAAGSTTSAVEMVFKDRVVPPSNEAEEVASPNTTQPNFYQLANNFLSDATEVVSLAIAPPKEDDDKSKAGAPPIVDIVVTKGKKSKIEEREDAEKSTAGSHSNNTVKEYLPTSSPTTESVAELSKDDKSAHNSILEDGSLKPTDGGKGDVDMDEYLREIKKLNAEMERLLKRGDPADVDLAKVLKHRSKVLCKNMAAASSRAASKTGKVTSRAAVRTSKVVGKTSSSFAKSSKKRTSKAAVRTSKFFGQTSSSIAKSSKKGIESVSSRVASKKTRAADSTTSKDASTMSKVADQTSSSTAKSSKKGLGPALKRVGSMRGKFTKSKQDGATKTTGNNNIVSSTSGDSSFPFNGGRSDNPEEQKSNSACNIFEGVFCCFG